jgi:tRNA dimethylallyltransferase
MRSVAYRQGWRHLAGKTDADEFAEETLAATRQLAKRQLTWLRHEPAALWYDLSQSEVNCLIFNKVEQFLENPA